MDILKEEVKRLFATVGVDQPDNLIRRNSDGTVSVAVERAGIMWAITVMPSMDIPDVERDEAAAKMLYLELVRTDWEAKAQKFKSMTRAR